MNHSDMWVRCGRDERLAGINQPRSYIPLLLLLLNGTQVVGELVYKNGIYVFECPEFPYASRRCVVNDVVAWRLLDWPRWYVSPERIVEERFSKALSVQPSKIVRKRFEWNGMHFESSDVNANIFDFRVQRGLYDLPVYKIGEGTELPGTYVIQDGDKLKSHLEG